MPEGARRVLLAEDDRFLRRAAEVRKGAPFFGAGVALMATLTEMRDPDSFGPEQATELLFFLAKVLENTIRAWLDLPE